ncbi:unnamed protein product [Rotaria sordida]|uniref:F-box domain-containing protein n=1 Tax=Rotaria sordida TaxID=392033 RepID=A0A815INB4_9BILA|nr:unnamed protein product [Rotaria sordida]
MLNKNEINILDLPDEMLLSIFNKLNNIDILYSLVDVNQRFDRLVFNSLYIHDLNFTSNLLLDCEFKEYSKHFNRICTSILPRIRHQINKLTLRQLSIQRVLYTCNFPQLHSLSLVSIDLTRLLLYLIDCPKFHYLLRNQIMYFNLDIQSNNTKSFESVNNFDDCLYLLDGRFNRLSTLIIDIEEISISIATIENLKQLSKLKCFSLISIEQTRFYDDQIVPLIRQMSNLEELTLFLIIKRYDSSYIDGIQLYDQILIHMPRLNKFTFSINTLVHNRYVNITLPSNDDIQRSFIERKYQQVGSYADDNLIEYEARCHIYSLPYQFDNFHHLNNSFQGGIFEKVDTPSFYLYEQTS